MADSSRLGPWVRRFLLEHLIQERNLSQEELANAARLHQAEISKIESAKLSTGLDVLQRLAKALGARPADLLDDK